MAEKLLVENISLFQLVFLKDRNFEYFYQGPIWRIYKFVRRLLY